MVKLLVCFVAAQHKRDLALRQTEPCGSRTYALDEIAKLLCFAVALYRPHASGADLDTNERALLARIAGDAAAVYAELENDQLRSRIATLER
jgi:hypothetical protein